MRIQLLTIGDELLDGLIVDGNAAWLGQSLAQMGLTAAASRTERDERAQLVEAFKAMTQASDVLICTGGLGPTSDDITVECLAEAAGVERVFDPACWAHILKVYGKRTPPESNRRQCLIPAGGHALETLVGTAPGVRLRVNGCEVFAFPGVPRELRWHFERHLKPFLEAQRGAARRYVASRAFVVIGESDLAEKVHALGLPASLTVAYLAKPEGVLVKLSGTDREAVEQGASRLDAMAPDRLIGEHLNLPQYVLDQFGAAGLTLGTAESCTGGLIGAAITALAGSSAVYKGGIISYANSAKTHLLGVPQQILDTEGAVSEACAQAMAEGARRALDVDVAVSVTGIAGPGGATPGKPVGTVCFGWASAQGSGATTKHISGGRERVRLRSVGIALDRARRCLNA